MRIQITKPASEDLQSIEDFISKDNIIAANRVIRRILKVIEHLRSHPTMGRKGREDNTRELVVGGTPFIAIYEIRFDIILILRILHTSRKWSW